MDGLAPQGAEKDRPSPRGAEVDGPAPRGAEVDGLARPLPWKQDTTTLASGTIAWGCCTPDRQTVTLDAGKNATVLSRETKRSVCTSEPMEE